MTSKAVRKYVKDPDRVECGARTSDGDPCKNPPMLGGKRCRMHGGAAPQVKRKAHERLAKRVPEMLRKLRDLTEDDSVPPQVRLAAIRDWLDRAGIDRKIEVEVSATNPFEEMIAGVVASVSEEAQVANHLDYAERADVIDAEVVEDDEPTQPSRRRDRDAARLPGPSPTKPYEMPDA